MRHRLHTGRATAASDEATPRRFVNDPACITIGTDPWAARGRRFRAILISAMLLHETCHSIDSPNAAPISL